MRRGQVGCDKIWRRLRFPNEKGSRTSGYSLRLKVGELVPTTELIRFQETTRVFSTVKTFFLNVFTQTLLLTKIFSVKIEKLV